MRAPVTSRCCAVPNGLVPYLDNCKRHCEYELSILWHQQHLLLLQVIATWQQLRSTVSAAQHWCCLLCCWRTCSRGTMPGPVGTEPEGSWLPRPLPVEPVSAAGPGARSRLPPLPVPCEYGTPKPIDVLCVVRSLRYAVSCAKQVQLAAKTPTHKAGPCCCAVRTAGGAILCCECIAVHCLTLCCGCRPHACTSHLQGTLHIVMSACCHQAGATSIAAFHTAAASLDSRGVLPPWTYLAHPLCHLGRILLTCSCISLSCLAPACHAATAVVAARLLLLGCLLHHEGLMCHAGSYCMLRLRDQSL
jgi:hypothetical protein